MIEYGRLHAATDMPLMENTASRGLNDVALRGRSALH